MNIKGGFNRFFVVLTAFWAVFCLFVYPNQQQQEAEKNYKSEMLYCCYEHEFKNGLELKDCLAYDEFFSSVDMWSLRAFYACESWFLALVVIVIPLMAYGLCRVLAIVGNWVWHGFKPNRSAPTALR